MTRAPDTVGEVMTREVATVLAEDPVDEAVRVMVERDIGSVVVVEGERPVGMLTERDLLRRLRRDTELLRRPVGEVMSSPVVTVAPGAEMIEAFDLMNQHGIRRLPVVETDRLVGVVADRDLLRWVSAVAEE